MCLEPYSLSSALAFPWDCMSLVRSLRKVLCLEGGVGARGASVGRRGGADELWFTALVAPGGFGSPPALNLSQHQGLFQCPTHIRRTVQRAAGAPGSGHCPRCDVGRQMDQRGEPELVSPAPSPYRGPPCPHAALQAQHLPEGADERAWRIPGTEEPNGLPSMGSHRVGRHNTKGHCHCRALSGNTRRFHTQLNKGPETP